MPEEEYYDSLFSLEKKLLTQDWLSRTRVWNKLFLQLANPLTPADLPLALALIHPDNWINWEGDEINLSEEGWGSKKLLKCEFDEITSHVCPWNADKYLQGTLHHDHRWPKSLGGPESGFNLPPLCANHNRAKGNGLWGFDWKKIPEWLGPRLEELRDSKLVGVDSNKI